MRTLFPYRGGAGGGGGAPSGPAGGDLAGTYPNPTVPTTPTQDEKDALDSAPTPATGANPFVTLADAAVWRPAFSGLTVIDFPGDGVPIDPQYDASFNNTTSWDFSNGAWDNDAANFIVPKTGIYTFTVQCYVVGSPAPTDSVQMILTANGSPVFSVVSTLLGFSGAIFTGVVTVLLPLNAVVTCPVTVTSVTDISLQVSLQSNP